MTKSNELLEQALKYAAAGWHVHPCKLDKTPYLKDWPGKATNDPDRIREWWSKWPDASIGCATGEASGMWVLDADLPDGPPEIERMKLPPTLTQKTGGGGFQYFWNSNGTEIRNSARKVGPGLDVRGNGGYVILPPSKHPSGGQYTWILKRKVADAPEDLVRKAAKPPAPERDRTLPGDTTPYGQAALTQEIVRLSAARGGERNVALNQSAYAMGQLIAGGELNEGQARTALLSTALALGLGHQEATKTIESGFKGGSAKPRESDKSDKSDKSDTSDTVGHNRTRSDKSDRPGERFPGKIKDELVQYCKENQGSFMTTDIDREFGLTHRQDKKNRSWALKEIEKELYIKKDPRVAGKWHILSSSAEWIDFENTSQEYFDLSLPLGLSSMVRLPQKCIVVVAGTSNAGKTALLLNILKANIEKPYERIYLMSEMGPSEYRQRVERLKYDPSMWQAKVKASSVTSGYDGKIMHHNRDGLSVIDFLEEIEGEYYKITSDIRQIYDALGNGVAIVALQKHSRAAVGRGGEGTTEKARLYLTIDTLAHHPRSTISAIKIIKAKDYQGDNPNGLERHVEIRHGSEITPVSKWMYCNAIQREQWIRHYEKKFAQDEPIQADEKPSVYFMLESGKEVRIRDDQLQRWRDQFSNIDVDAELVKISQDSRKKGFLTDKYMFQIPGILSRKSKNRMLEF